MLTLSETIKINDKPRCCSLDHFFKQMSGDSGRWTAKSLHQRFGGVGDLVITGLTAQL
jgi:hypothetical protein